MPTYPIKEQIVQAVETAVKLITKTNGYQTDVGTVQRPRMTGEGYNPSDLGVGIYEGNPARDTDEDVCDGSPAIGWRLPVYCDLTVRHSEKSTVPLAQVLNTFEADVQKALMQDCTWGGLAINTKLGAPVGFAQQGFEGVSVSIVVTYRVSENDPYTNRA